MFEMHDFEYLELLMSQVKKSHQVKISNPKKSKNHPNTFIHYLPFVK